MKRRLLLMKNKKRGQADAGVVGIILVLISLAVILPIAFKVNSQIFHSANTSLTTTVIQDVNNESILMPNQTATIDLAHTAIRSFTRIENVSGGIYPATNYSVNLATGVITVLDNQTYAICKANVTCYAYYTLNNESASQESATLLTAQTNVNTGFDIGSLLPMVMVFAGIFALMLGLKK